MRKKLLCMLIAGTITSSICIGCGNTGTQPTTQTETTESTEQPTTEPNITETIAPTEQPTVEPAAPAEEVETTEQSEESAEPVEEPAETLTETPAVVDEPQAQYTYTDLSATMYAQQNVNVRDLPSTDGNKLGGLSTNQEVTVTGQCNETSWYRFEYNGSVAYVSNNYLGDSQVEVAQASAQSTGNTGTTTPAETECPVDLYVIHDEGDMVYMWGEFHHPDYRNKVLTDFNKLHDYITEKWDSGYYGYQDCDTHVDWYHEGWDDTLCRWVFVPK